MSGGEKVRGSGLVRENVAAGLLTLAVGMVSVMESLRLRPLRGAKPVGDDTFPFLLGIALVLMGVLLVFSKAPMVRGLVWPARSQLWVMGLALAALGAYCVLIPLLGYVVGTFLVGAALFGAIGRYRWYLCLGMGAVLALGLRQVFVIWLRMPFPTGIWGI